MKIQRVVIGLLLTVLLFIPACDQFNRLTATKIKDILDNPRKYENKEVTVYGTVSDEFSFLVIKYFEIKDDSGAIKVMTARTLPKKGEKLTVTGTVETIEIGPNRLMMIREKDEKQKEKKT
ncbi:MAG: hypothetical protein ACREQK_05160 [Candidatus Binatia bacterium]